MRKLFIGVLLVMVLLLGVRWTTVSAATNFLYGNNAGTPHVFKMDPTTMTIQDTFTGLSGGNGRGCVVVGTTMYYTGASSNAVFSYNISTHTLTGTAFTVSGASGLSTMAFDGTNFWIGDYSGTNQAFSYSPTGTLLKTIHLANCTQYCDGLEYFLQGGTTPRLISNRVDGCCGIGTGIFDIYDLNGNVVTANFFTTGTDGTGIAWDGTNFFVSNLGAGSIFKYNGTTGALISTTAINGTGTSNGVAVEDLSADYAVTLGPPPTQTVPALNTWGLIFCGILLLFVGGKMVQQKLAA